MTKTKEINENLTLDQCWKMCNNIQHAKTPEETRERCTIAEAWLTANTVISVSEYDELMDYVAWLYRDSFVQERECQFMYGEDPLFEGYC